MDGPILQRETCSPSKGTYYQTSQQDNLPQTNSIQQRLQQTEVNVPQTKEHNGRHHTCQIWIVK